MRLAAASALTLLFAAAAPGAAEAQWTNRYPRVEGYSHHVYLEGYELPTLTSGPMDPAPSPDGGSVAIAARGWIWLLDPASGVARRVTDGPNMDSRPAWSPYGRRLAFVRDDGRDTWIVVRDLETGEERVVADEEAIELDPAFSPDGAHLFYASAAAGDVDLWRLELATGTTRRLAEEPGIERNPRPAPDGTGLLYLRKARRGEDRIVWLALRETGAGEEPAGVPGGGQDAAPGAGQDAAPGAGQDAAPGGDQDAARADTSPPARRTLASTRIASQAGLDLAPDGRTVVYTWPHEGGWELRLLDAELPGTSVLLARGWPGPLAPAFDAAGRWVWFAEATADESTTLKRVPADGGRVETVAVRAWEWGEPPGRLRIRTSVAGDPGAAPARLSVVDEAGHPAVPDIGSVRFDGQNGRVFYYSPGVLELTVPAGEVRVSAVQGLLTPEVTATVNVEPGETREVELELERVWDPRPGGWVAGDHHFHVNYGGPYELDPEDLLLDLRGEGVDVATPLLANLHNRFGDQRLWGWRSRGGPPIVAFGQEVRSHFLGHMNLIGIRDLFWPWVWGPAYQVYGRDDRPNAEALAHAHAQGGLGGYVHPVSVRDPFAPDAAGSVPIELVPDAVLGDVDLLEVACLWTDELGTSEVWYRLLSLGRPVAASAGTDVMNDFYRTMAVGTTRVYVRVDGPLNLDAYLEGLAEGRSVVTNGPMLELTVEGAGPGEAIEADPGGESESGPSGDPGAAGRGVAGAGSGGTAAWNLELHSAIPVDSVELLVNGRVVWREAGLARPGSRTYSGSVDLPAAGWIAARARGGETVWPAMDSYPFAHTSPVWIGRVGSVEPAAAARAARELLGILDAAQADLRRGYGDAPIPKLTGRFRRARAFLTARLSEDGG